MLILVLYATTDGQTRKIARHVADRLITSGHSVELLHAADAADLDPTRHAAAVVAGSVHAGRYQSALADAVRLHAAALNAKPTLFLSVSLTAAGNDAEERAELDAIATRFAEATGWTPGRVLQVAGAVRFEDYGFFTYWALRWIVARKDAKATGKENVEYTDWAALDRELAAWTASLAA